MSLTLQPGRQLRGIDIRLLPSDLFRFSGHILRGASEGRLEANVLLPCGRTSRSPGIVTNRASCLPQLASAAFERAQRDL
jgi:hypothetical protein